MCEACCGGVLGLRLVVVASCGLVCGLLKFVWYDLAQSLPAAEQCICDRALQAYRYILRKKGETDESNVEIKVLTAEQSEDKDTHFKDPESGVELEEVEKKPLLEWLAENYKKVGFNILFAFRDLRDASS